MNVPDSWVKSVCEKLGISEPQVEFGVFGDGDEMDEMDELGDVTMGYLDGRSGDQYQRLNGCSWEHFKAFSPETLAAIKKDLGIE
jgi:hypothetical protein